MTSQKAPETGKFARRLYNTYKPPFMDYGAIEAKPIPTPSKTVIIPSTVGAGPADTGLLSLGELGTPCPAQSASHHRVGERSRTW